MTNEVRKTEILKMFGNVIEGGENGLVKTAGQGWSIVVKDEGIIKLNNGSKIIKGKQPGGLLEAFVELKRLNRVRNEEIKKIKEAKRQIEQTTVETKPVTVQTKK